GGIVTNPPEYATGDTFTPTPGANGSRRPSGLAMVVMAALVLTAIVAIWSMVVRLDRASYVSGLINRSTTFNEAQATAKDDHVRGALVAVLLTALATAAVFITWFAIVVRRLHAARPSEFRHGRGWAIGAWFVPIVNLIYPKQMADDAWRAATGRTQPVPAVFHFWWAAWLAGNATTFIGNRITNSNDPSLLMNGDRVAGVGEAISAIGAILAIIVVARLDVAAQRAALLPAAPQPSPWPPTPLQPGSPWPPAAPMPGFDPAAPTAPATAAEPQPPAPAATFNPPPGWPAPPPGWVPPPGWQPDPAWPPAPPDWQFWVPANPT
ncbi:MAG: hypothetical protein QOD07_2219, partial [Frankiaceae bacterium]|nr:hypothetical protein [Frankiaceae bacterium]